MDTREEKHKTYDVANFTIGEMTECGMFLRKIAENTKSMEETADRIVRYFYDSLIDGQTGNRACALIRFFKTHKYGQLDNELRDFAENSLGDVVASPGMKCLVLLATAGERPEWESRKTSSGHKAIPLPSENALQQIPMIKNLTGQLGISAGMVVNPDPALILDMEQRTYNVFYVPDASGSPYIPAQKEFVIPCGIKSVLGFGGILPSGEIFAIIMFLKVHIPKEAADLFKTLSLNVKIAVLPFERAVFA
jgi:hypothetical protein